MVFFVFFILFFHNEKWWIPCDLCSLTWRWEPQNYSEDFNIKWPCYRSPCLCCHSFLMCGLFELKQTCADLLLFVYNCIAVEDPIIKRRRVGIPFFGLILQHFCACPKQEPVHGLFCVQWFEMRGRLFVDSGGIVDNQFLLLPHIDWMSSTS